MKDETWRTWWEIHADPETFLREQLPRTKNVRQMVYEMMRSVLKPGASVLDVACGAGVDYAPITEMRFNWVGVDFTQKFVDYLHDKYEGKVNVYQMDVSQGIRFKDQQFNLSYAKDLFEHLAPQQWKRAISEMWRVSSEYMILAFFRPPDENPTDYRRVTEKENPNTAGVYSNHYNRKEFVDYIKNLPGFHSVSIKENILYRPKWGRPKGYSIWLVKRK